MKKIVLLLLLVGLLTTSCKKEEPAPVIEKGTVSLDPATAELVYNTTVKLTPKFSETGIAKEQAYTWKSNNELVATVDKGTVIAKRIGTAEISYVSSDGAFTAKSVITVNARSNILGNVYYKKSADKVAVEAQESGTLNTTESTASFRVYDRVPTSVVKIIRIVYQFDDSNKLVATYAALENDAAGANKLSLEKYLEERYEYTSELRSMWLYKADVAPFKYV
ncbi:MAG: Ig-like domain-containing protein [Paludibacteraceae bacterium]